MADDTIKTTTEDTTTDTAATSNGDVDGEAKTGENVETPIEEIAENTTVAEESTEVEIATEPEEKADNTKKIPEFRAGDTVRISYKIKEGDKTRLQPYEGIVISTRGEGVSKTFIVRKIGADNVGVERIFPLFSPNIEKIQVMKHGKVRRAKLYYMRSKKGREAKTVKELK